jgi:hypothetical protein
MAIPLEQQSDSAGSLHTAATGAMPHATAAPADRLDQHSHAGHHHDHSVQKPASAVLRPSWFLRSAAERLILAAALSAMVWLGVAWALGAG